MTTPTTKLAIVIDLEQLRGLMREFCDGKGMDDQWLMRRLHLSEFLEWLRQRQQMEATNETKTDGYNETANLTTAVPATKNPVVIFDERLQRTR